MRRIIDNDLQLNEHCMAVRQLADTLPKLLRERNQAEIWHALKLIHAKAELAMYRVNDLTFPRE